MVRTILFDHDGALEDFLSLMLLLTLRSPEQKLLGVVVTPADCYAGAAVRVTRKILDLVSAPIPVALSTVRGVNPFPPLYRRDACIIDYFPILNEHPELSAPLVEQSGQTFFRTTLEAAKEPITLLITGPLTNLAITLQNNPAITEKITELVWMGGALEVPGNVEKLYAPEQDGTAEWNAYWDPEAVATVWGSSIRITLCPLDITNSVPVTAEFIQQLTQQRQYPLSDLAGLCYSLAMPQNYYCWDILATGYLGRRDLYTLREIKTSVIASGPSQGRLLLDPNGRSIQVMTDVNRTEFFQYILRQFTQLVPR
ncbi:MAG: nucleoside hydrolase [Cyanobacteria bacterium P01_H01_bin.15]